MSTVAKAAKTSATMPTAAAEVDAFLARVKAAPKGGQQGRLVFAMDATMSRQPTWDRALSIQGQMFREAARSGSLAVQLVYFRGLNECRASRWVRDAENLAGLMTKVDCRGGNTQISKVLQHVKRESSAEKVNAMVFVGDACEENVDALCHLAGEIALHGTPVFMFQEGSDTTAESAFREIARLTRGAYFRLDGSAPQVLAELLGAVAAYAAGGRKALEATNNSASRILLQQLK